MKMVVKKVVDASGKLMHYDIKLDMKDGSVADIKWTGSLWEFAAWYPDHEIIMED